ncbi:MAG: NAD(+) diphosphatase [Pseudomonadota bacterium]|nr:NAD(+) diphosphatase [Pseudomonadota bacterium]
MLDFDRVVARRRDATWLAEKLQDPDTCFLPCWRSQNLFVGEESLRPALLSAVDLGDLLLPAAPVIFLGISNQQSWFTFELPADDEMVPERLTPFGTFHNLRRILPQVAEADYALLAYARAMTFWHRRNRYCGFCGSIMVSGEGGHLLTCSNSSCGQQNFPRTDPAVIMRVYQGERCLMARQASWPQGMYSVLAGFVEPGETLEEAVKREVREESGIIVRQVKYFSSQPWPFPASLMLGFTAEFESGEIFCADQELEEVCWFSREDVRRGIKQGSLKLPVKGTLSYRLISDWLAGDAGG